MRNICILASVLVVAAAAQAQMRITEFMYNGTGSTGEFVEFTNIGLTAIDLTGWSFDDSSRIPGSQSLSAFGVVQPGQSVILTDVATAGEFRTMWNLPGTVAVVAANANNLGRSDEINLYDNSAVPVLIDRLTYNDQGTGDVKGPRTNGVSAWAEPAELGLNNASLWQLSVVGDAQGSWTSTANEIGSPGTYVVPEPLTLGLLAAGGLMLVRRRCRA